MANNQLPLRPPFSVLAIGCVLFSLFQLFKTNVCPEFLNCDCKPDNRQFQINCSGTTDIREIQDLLRTYFGNRDVSWLKLTKCKLTSLPQNSFGDYHINYLHLECPLKHIPLEALRFTPNLTGIELNNAMFLKFPVGLQNLTSLETLSLMKCKLRHLSQELRNFDSLLFLKIRQCILESVSKDAFVHATNIQYLDLSYNKLVNLDKNTFRPLKKLKSINLNENQLISLDGLFESLNPVIISASGNNLSNVDNVFHNDMWALKELNLGKNPLGFISASAIDDKLKNLDFLDLSNTRLFELDPDLLKKCRHLRRIKLWGNTIKQLPPRLFYGLSKLEEIDLSRNNISSLLSGMFSTNHNLRAIILDRNNIRDITNVFLNLPRLKSLLLQSNDIQALRNDDFRSLPGLQMLHVGRNSLQQLDRHVFSGLKNLRTLHLSSNELKSLNGTLRDLPELQQVTCKSTILEQITSFDVYNLPKLSHINLANNKLKSVNGAFRKLNSLAFINLNENYLSTLSRDTLPEKIAVTDIYLDNPWECDCRILWLMEWLIESNGAILKSGARCASPPHLHKARIVDLTAENLTAWYTGCPFPCKCSCHPQGRDFYIAVNCSFSDLNAVPSKLPELSGILDLKGNQISEVSMLASSKFNGLKVLNLSDNVIKELDLQFPSSLRVLALDGNLLSTFPWKTLANLPLESLTLSRNPWICDRETVGFKTWLLTSVSSITDVNNTRCGDIEENGPFRNKIIVDLLDTELCPSKVGLYVAIATGTIAIFLTGVAVVFVYMKYGLQLKVWMYSHGLTWVKEDDLDTDKIFDALISHSMDDQDFVFTILRTGLENEKPSFSLCIPGRDTTYAENDKLTVITKCKRIIIVLSRSYLQDESCMEIFRNAAASFIGDKANRVIIIEYGELPAKDDMDPALKNILESTSTIAWAQKMFWEKLRYAMPKKKKGCQCQQAQFYRNDGY